LRERGKLGNGRRGIGKKAVEKKVLGAAAGARVKPFRGFRSTHFETFLLP